MRIPGLGARQEAMSKVDTAWLHMEKSTNPMMITGVMMFAGALPLDGLRRVIGERFLSYRRFRQKAVDLDSSAFWEDDPDLDMEWHVRRTALPGKAGQAELQELVSQLASTPLDHARPLWQFHLVERFDGGSALIGRIHHCYADGIALMQVLLSLTDVAPKADRKASLKEAWLESDGSRVEQRVGGAPPVAALDRALGFGGGLLRKGLELTRDPVAAGHLAQEGAAMLAELAHALALTDDSPTVLRGPIGVAKRCAWAEPIDLGEVKAVCRGLDCTVNDILMAAAAGALRAYLLERGEAVDGLSLRATVPVNLRPLEHAKKLGNHFGLVFLDLPVGEANPLARLDRVAASMREIKGSKQALVTFGVLAALGSMPRSLQRMALDFLSRKATAVATNVPGPQVPLYMAGARLDQIMFWVPQSGSIGVGISILSYNGRVHFGLIADRKRLPEPEAVIRHFRPEFEKLLYLLLMSDWDTAPTPAQAEALLPRDG